MIDLVLTEFERNKNIFIELYDGIDDDMLYWRRSKNKWCLLEVICHLYDEERLDFRFRTQWVLDRPNELPPSFDPADWVEEHQYMVQNGAEMVQKFVEERDRSIAWLKELKNPNWNNGFDHLKRGRMTGKYLLSNWLAHDYLHIRQILKQKFDYLKLQSGTDLDYAGVW